MNPSYEAMERARREKLASLLQIGREQAVKRLEELHLSGDSHAMLSQIGYAINPYVSAWDVESCDHLRRVLAELIGDASEAASGAEHRCACGAGGCDRGHEQTALETERQKAVNKLRDTFLDTGSALKKLATALGVYWDASNTNKSVASLQKRLIHLLGGDEYYVLDTSKAKTIGCEHDVSESDDSTSVTKELRKYVSIHETMNTVYTTMPPRMEEEPTHKGKKLLAIADKIDAQFARVCEQHEVVLQDANSIQLLAECLKPVIADNDKRVAKLEAERDDLRERLDEASAYSRNLFTQLTEVRTTLKTIRDDAAWGLAGGGVRPRSVRQEIVEVSA